MAGRDNPMAPPGETSAMATDSANDSVTANPATAIAAISGTASPAIAISTAIVTIVVNAGATRKAAAKTATSATGRVVGETMIDPGSPIRFATVGVAVVIGTITRSTVAGGGIEIGMMTIGVGGAT